MQKLQVEAAHGIDPQKTRKEIATFFRQQAEAQNEVEVLRGGKQELPDSTSQVNKDSFEAIII